MEPVGTVSVTRLAAIASAMRLLERKVGLVNGCFDLLHPGHVAFLRVASRCCDCLLVAVDSDENVARLKGPGRPIVPIAGRIDMVSSIRGVYAAAEFFDIYAVIDLVRPDVILKGAEYAHEEIRGHDMVEEVIRVPMHIGPTRHHHYSTTSLIEQIRKWESCVES